MYICVYTMHATEGFLKNQKTLNSINHGGNSQEKILNSWFSRMLEILPRQNYQKFLL